jgi:predicted metal-dependent phosphoesterase TrpH
VKVVIDLHTHTTVSDGTDTPAQLVNKALAQGLDTLAITDHDAIAGWSSAVQTLRGDLKLVLGAEISCLTKAGVSVHMLGLLFDGTNSALLETLENTRDDRLPRMRKMIELMQADGIDISIADVEAAMPAGATMGRPHLADALVAKKIIKTRDEAFVELLNNESKYYVTHFAPTPEDAIKLIRAAGGVAVIAHPFASLRGQILQSSDFIDLKEAGLNGIEVNHRDQSNEERLSLLSIASDLDLVMTGSSDYHGTGKLNSLGENVTDPAEWERLEAMADARRVVTA